MGEVIEVTIPQLIRRADNLEPDALRELATSLFGPEWWDTPNPDFAGSPTGEDGASFARSPSAAMSEKSGPALVRDRIWTALFGGMT